MMKLFFSTTFVSGGEEMQGGEQSFVLRGRDIFENRGKGDEAGRPSDRVIAIMGGTDMRVKVDGGKGTEGRFGSRHWIVAGMASMLTVEVTDPHLQEVQSNESWRVGDEDSRVQ